ncbi:MAG TPA: hypothetical protein VIR26_05275 [Metalysinibacillus sp.]
MKQQKKVIAFPGMIYRAYDYMENYEWDKAAKIFDQVVQHQELKAQEAFVYAFALSEVKRYQEAKAICETLMESPTDEYWDVVELYIKVSMQLKNYQQVEKFITTLIDDRAVPKERYDRFQHLHSLNAKIAQQDITLSPTIDVFFEREVPAQIAQLYEWQNVAIAKQQDFIVAIVEHPKAHPMVQSLALLLLVEQRLATTVTIKKLGQQLTVHTNDLQLPTQMPQYKYIASYLEDSLMQDPTALEMANQLIVKHAIMTYPLEWHPFAEDDVAIGYKQFIEELFGKVQEVDVDVQQYLHQLEEISMLYDV